MNQTYKPKQKTEKLCPNQEEYVRQMVNAIKKMAEIELRMIKRDA